MKATETRNARIDHTFLGVEDHGILVLSVHLDYGDGTHQGYQRQFTPEQLRHVLDAAGADSWENLRGRHVRARIEDGMIQKLLPIIGPIPAEPTDGDDPDSGEEGER